MLVLSRKQGESIVLSGGITLSVVKVEGGRVRIGVEAPEEVRILRGELAFGQEDEAAGMAVVEGC